MKMTYLIVAGLLLAAFGAGYALSQRGGEPAPQANNTNTVQSEDTNSPSGKKVDLSGKQLTSFPEEVLLQDNVTELNLSNNQLTGLPSNISELTNLQILNVENNRLEAFPDEIAGLKNLRQILANNNRMQTVSPGLTEMTWLEVLDISGNNIPADQADQLKSQLPDTQVKN
jgi:Leucine-rich repeat (LRR) protein